MSSISDLEIPNDSVIYMTLKKEGTWMWGVRLLYRLPPPALASGGFVHIWILMDNSCLLRVCQGATPSRTSTSSPSTRREMKPRRS
jgi:hypothetical protein